MAVIFVGSSFSKLPDPGVSDKTAHFWEYAVLGVLLARALAGRRWLSIGWRPVVAAVALAALYGVSDELHQLLLVPGRQYDVRDMMADALGASVSAGSVWAWGIIRRFSARSGPTTGDQQQATNDDAVRTPSART